MSSIGWNCPPSCLLLIHHILFSSYYSLALRGYTDPAPTSMGHSRAPFDSDPVLETSNVDHWLTHEASPREKKEFSNVYDRSVGAPSRWIPLFLSHRRMTDSFPILNPLICSLHKFKTSVSDPRMGREGRNRDRDRDDQDGSSELDGYPYRGGLSAPKVRWDAMQCSVMSCQRQYNAVRCSLMRRSNGCTRLSFQLKWY